MPSCPRFLNVPLGPLVLESSGACNRNQKVKRIFYQVIVVVLTFLCYMSFHMTRKTISVVKTILDPPPCNPSIPDTNVTLGGGVALGGLHINESFLNGKEINETTIPCRAGWPPFDGANGETELGILDYSFLFAYALAMFISGMIADRTPLRYFLTIGMLGSVLMTVALGAGYWLRIHSIAYYVVVQILGGLIQSTGWPGVVAVMANWFGKGRRGFIMGLWNSHTSVGNIVGTVVPAAFEDFGWGWAFVSTGGIMFIVTLIVFFCLPTEPELVDLTPPKTDQNQQNDGGSSVTPRPLNSEPTVTADTTPLMKGGSEDGDNDIQDYEVPPQESKQEAIGFFRAFCIPGVIEYSMALFFSKLVAYTFLFWLPFYIKNAKHEYTVTVFESAWLASMFDVGGIVGSAAIGLISDVFKSRAIPTFVFLIISVPVLFIYKSYGGVSEVASIFLVMLSGFFVNGPYSIITTAISADLGTHKTLKGNQKAKATVTAIIDGTGSIGAAIGPLLTGWLVKYGWNSVFYLLMSSCFLSAVFTIRLVISEVLKLIKFVRKKLCHTSSESNHDGLEDSEVKIK